jgi:hypothetical protein
MIWNISKTPEAKTLVAPTALTFQVVMQQRS